MDSTAIDQHIREKASTTAKQHGAPACCQEITNLVMRWERPDLTVTTCTVCGRRQFRLVVEGYNPRLGWDTNS